MVITYRLPKTAANHSDMQDFVGHTNAVGGYGNQGQGRGRGVPSYNATTAMRIQLLKLITEGEPKTVRFAAERLLEEFVPRQKRVAINGGRSASASRSGSRSDDE